MKLKYVQHKKLYRLTPLNEEIKRIETCLWCAYGQYKEKPDMKNRLVAKMVYYLKGLKKAKELIAFKG